MLLHMRQAPRCRARTRRGSLCQSPAMKNGRCRMHGGTSPGAPKGNKNAYKHGHYTADAIARRRSIATLIRTGKKLTADIMAVPKTQNLECPAECGSQPPAYAPVLFPGSVFKLHGEELLRSPRNTSHKKPRPEEPRLSCNVHIREREYSEDFSRTPSFRSSRQ